MNITFLFPKRVISGGTRVIFEYAVRLRKKGHNVNIVYPIVPFRVLPDGHTFKTILWTVKQLIKEIINYDKIGWFDFGYVKRVPFLSLKYLNGMEYFLPDSDVIVATTWDSAYVVDKLSSGKWRKYYFVQSYEVWGLWNNDYYWEQAKKDSPGGIEVLMSMVDLIPSEKEVVAYKSLVDAAFKLNLRKITISSWLAKLIKEKFHEPVQSVIMNGVDANNFYCEHIPKNANGSNVKILFPFRTEPLKGARDAIAAFELIREKYQDVDFFSFGVQANRGLPAWIKFEIGGTDAKLRKLYNSADIFVCPSWIEGWGLTSMEAMACGCAVVATDSGAILDFAIPGKTVITSPPRDPIALANAVIDLIENPSKRTAIAGAGNSYVQQFSWDKSADRLEKVLSA